MADEIKLTASLSVEKGSTIAKLSIGPLSLTMTGTSAAHQRQTVGTSEEVLALGADIAAGGYVLIINRDSTNYVEIFPTGDQATALIRISALEFAIFRSNAAASAAPYVQANTDVVEIETLVLDL